MPRPGVTVELLEDAPSGQAVLNSGQSFFVGVAERGRLQAVRVGSVADYTREFGDRAGGSVLHDSVSAYFSEGGATLWVSTIAGPGALAATAQLPPYNVAAAGTGEWGNDLTVEAVDATATGGTGAVQIVVTYDGTIVERSPILIPSAPEAGESWNSDYVHLDYSTGDLAVGGPVDLAGGVDDATVTAATITAALDRFTYALGPGQVAYPGATTTMAFDALLAHVDKTRRVALLDAPDTSDPAALKALAQTVSQNPLAKYAAMFAPWAMYPGAGSTTVTVPYSPVQAGLLARSDAATQNPNLAAAGTNGIARSALGLSKSYSDTDRQALNEAGLTLAVQKYGTIRTYGARSLAGAGNLTWLWFGGAREVMRRRARGRRDRRELRPEADRRAGHPVRRPERRSERHAPRALQPRGAVRRDARGGVQRQHRRLYQHPRHDRQRRGARHHPPQDVADGGVGAHRDRQNGPRPGPRRLGRSNPCLYRHAKIPTM